MTSKREDREALIEKALIALMHDPEVPTGVRPHILGGEVLVIRERTDAEPIVEAALAVFEQAHTPTDDERAEVERVQKAAWAEIHGQDPTRKYSVAEVKRIVYSFDNVLSGLLARRPVQGEPTPVRFAARQGGKSQATIDALLAQANEHGIRVEVVYPQGEPTDAQVLAALNAYDPRSTTDDLADWSSEHVSDMRAALRADAAVTEQRGEKRG